MAILSTEAAYQVRRAKERLAARERRRCAFLQAAREAAEVLRSEYGAKHVWLFGSTVHDWFHEDSDLDLACEGVPLDQLGAAWDRVVEIVGNEVDLVAIEEADAHLRKRIQVSGERL